MKELVYGEVNEGLVLIEKSLANDLAGVRKALKHARTWGELKSAISPTRWRNVERLVTGEGEDPMPALDRPIDSRLEGPHADGDWPEWPAQEMLEWVPEDIRTQFGRVEDSVLNGSFLWLDPEREEQIVEAFERLGWSCEADGSLVLVASGWD